MASVGCTNCPTTTTTTSSSSSSSAMSRLPPSSHLAMPPRVPRPKRKASSSDQPALLPPPLPPQHYPLPCPVYPPPVRAEVLAPPPTEPPSKRSRPRSTRPSYSELAKWFAENLCYLWFASGPPSGPVSADAPAQYGALTHGLISPTCTAPAPVANWPARRLRPRSQFVLALTEVFRSLRPTQDSLLVALLYIRRFKHFHPDVLGGTESEYRASVAGLVLANKLLEDHTYTSKTWADIVGLPTKLVTACEAQLWAGLGFSIHVTSDQLAAWKTHVTHLLAQRASEIQASDLAAQQHALRHTSPVATPPMSFLASSPATPPYPLCSPLRYHQEMVPPPFPGTGVFSPISPQPVRAPSGQFTFTPPAYPMADAPRPLVPPPMAASFSTPLETTPSTPGAGLYAGPYLWGPMPYVYPETKPWMASGSTTDPLMAQALTCGQRPAYPTYNQPLPQYKPAPRALPALPAALPVRSWPL